MDNPRVVQLADGVLVRAKFLVTDVMRLWKSTFVPTPDSTIADFLANEVAFDGYAPAVLSSDWKIGLDANGHAQMIYNGLAAFLQTGVVTTDSAGGFFITDMAGPPTILKLVDAFVTPEPFNKNGNALLVKPTELLDGSSSNDAELIYGP